jgi:hypothetical protein
VNPDRRAQLTATAVGAAALLLAAGFGIGYAVAPSDNGHPRMRNVYPGLVLRPGLHPHLRPMPRIIPIPHGATTTVTVTPTPSPTST